jgi:choline dehydrogenase-like flavoprotein
MAKLDRVDVCIVGAGPGGTTTAMKCAKAGMKVVVLEAGPLKYPTKYDENEFFAFAWDTSEVPAVYDPATTAPNINRGKCVGGSTIHWTQVCLRFHETHFKMKSTYGIAEDWPLNYADLAPYYDEVEKLWGVAGRNGNKFQTARGPYPMPPHAFTKPSQILKRGSDKLGWTFHPAPIGTNSVPYDGRPACEYCNNCLSGCPTGAKASGLTVMYPRAVQAGAVFRTGCFASKVNLDAKGRAKSVSYLDSKGALWEQDARIVVISANSIESPRLLLHSTGPLFPEGLANSSGLVGKNLMRHPIQVNIGILPNEVTENWHSASTHGVVLDFHVAKKGDYPGGHMLEHLSYGPYVHSVVMSDLWGEKLKKHMHQYKNMVMMYSMVEDFPLESNRVTLDKNVKDARGVPVAHIRSVYTKEDLALLAKGSDRAKKIFKAAGATQTISAPIGDTGHLLGTCRMGTNPKTSVLNPYCRTHDVKNLFVIDGSNFVTGASVNPTLTIGAIALRANDYLIAEAKKGAFPA